MIEVDYENLKTMKSFCEAKCPRCESYRISMTVKDSKTFKCINCLYEFKMKKDVDK